MPFALIIVAAIFITVGLRGTQTQLFCLLKQDFTGAGNFLYWLAAVLLIGMLGYIPKLRPVSDAFLVLLVVVLFLASKGGLFTNLASAIGQTSITPTVVPAATTASTSTPTATTTQTTGLAQGQTLLSNSLALPTTASLDSGTGGLY